MGGWDDDTAIQRKAQLRLLSSLPALRLQDSAKRADAAGIAHPQVPEVRRSLRRDGRPETHQYLLSAALRSDKRRVVDRYLKTLQPNSFPNAVFRVWTEYIRLRNVRRIITA